MSNVCTLAIVGSRNFNDYDAFCDKLNMFVASIGGIQKINKIVSGGAGGADKMAERFARENKIELQVFAADWNRYGRAAGPMRNSQIVEAATHMVAFPSKDGRGTQDSLRKARKKMPTANIVEHVVEEIVQNKN